MPKKSLDQTPVILMLILTTTGQNSKFQKFLLPNPLLNDKVLTDFV